MRGAGCAGAGVAAAADAPAAHAARSPPLPPLQTSGYSLTAQEPYNNIIRTTVEVGRGGERGGGPGGSAAPSVHKHCWLAAQDS